MDFNRIISGMLRAARLDVSFYEEAERDPSYAQDALIVVIIASVAGAIGSFLSLLFGGSFGAAIGTLIYSSISGVLVYFFWAFLIYIVGTRLFKGTADFGEVQRTVGFAWTPRILGILSFIPVLGWIVAIVAWIWSIATGFIATRQALDLDNTNAALTVIVAAIAAFVIQLILGAIMGLIGLAGGAMAGLF
jgi:hypothetical protein